MREKPLTSHGTAVATMVLATLMWSIAGVVTRQLDAQGLAAEQTFWRSAGAAVSLALLLPGVMGREALRRSLTQGGWALWASALCWAMMFTAFMVALALTTVANVLVAEALGPLFAALIGRATLGQRLPLRTWGAIVLAGAGIVWMYGPQLAGAEPRHLLGSALAMVPPLGAASMWTLLQANERKHPGARVDMRPAVMLGAALSALACLPWAWPLQAGRHDLALLGGLGLVQLAIPCALAVAAGRVLSAPEAALLGLLEILFGVAWAWASGAEEPPPSVLAGGLMVLLALAGNEALAMQERRGT